MLKLRAGAFEDHGLLHRVVPPSSTSNPGDLAPGWVKLSRVASTSRCVAIKSLPLTPRRQAIRTQVESMNWGSLRGTASQVLSIGSSAGLRKRVRGRDSGRADP